MKTTLYTGLLLGLLLVAPMASAIDVSISPEAPEPGEPITASFPAPDGALNATVQVCIGDKCYIPAEMERQGDLFRHTFYINETGEAHLNVTVDFENGSETWEDIATFEVKEADGGNGTPGFSLVAAVAAVVAIALLYRRTKS